MVNRRLLNEIEFAFFFHVVLSCCINIFVDCCIEDFENFVDGNVKVAYCLVL